jgi:hypothetical protein
MEQFIHATIFLKRWETYENKRYGTYGFLKHPKQSENAS